METIEIALRIALVVDAIALIALIMVQQGKGANVGAAFGSGASQTMFGSGGASSFLNAVVTWLAIGFFVITFALAWTARERAEALGTVGIPQVEGEASESASEDFETINLPDDEAPMGAQGGDVPSLDARPATGYADGNADTAADVPTTPNGSN
ncbi:MAG TPA: preprotein translocase subunit SecG [Pseudomonadales bacterium]|nr:preprotein translocase subunit SecG [Pseudomonadales bacterium]